jgi:hypothetical protein
MVYILAPTEDLVTVRVSRVSLPLVHGSRAGLLAGYISHISSRWSNLMVHEDLVRKEVGPYHIPVRYLLKDTPAF